MKYLIPRHEFQTEIAARSPRFEHLRSLGFETGSDYRRLVVSTQALESAEKSALSADDRAAIKALRRKFDAAYADHVQAVRASVENTRAYLDRDPLDAAKVEVDVEVRSHDRIVVRACYAHSGYRYGFANRYVISEFVETDGAFGIVYCVSQSICHPLGAVRFYSLNDALDAAKIEIDEEIEIERQRERERREQTQIEYDRVVLTLELLDSLEVVA